MAHNQVLSISSTQTQLHQMATSIGVLRSTTPRPYIAQLPTLSTVVTAPQPLLTESLSTHQTLPSSLSQQMKPMDTVPKSVLELPTVTLLLMQRQPLFKQPQNVLVLVFSQQVQTNLHLLNLPTQLQLGLLVASTGLLRSPTLSPQIAPSPTDSSKMTAPQVLISEIWSQFLDPRSNGQQIPKQDTVNKSVLELPMVTLLLMQKPPSP